VTTDLKPGDVVRLKSGGADMTVRHIEACKRDGLKLRDHGPGDGILLKEGDLLIICDWHANSGEEKEKIYFAEMLKRIDRCDVCSNIDKSGDYWKCTTNDAKGVCYVAFSVTNDSDKRKLECYYEPSRFVRKTE
jgi:uncharacterized protein YodC (DUF2158 family)